MERTIRSRRGSREEAVGVCQRFSGIANWLPDVESAFLAEPGAQEGHGLLQVVGLLAVVDRRTSLV